MDDKKPPKTWKCGLTCRTFGSKDRQNITDLKPVLDDAIPS